MKPQPDANMDMKEIMRMAVSPAGQQLIQMLRNNPDPALRSAMDQAAAGNYYEAQKVLSRFLSTPEAQSLLRQLRR